MNKMERVAATPMGAMPKPALEHSATIKRPNLIRVVAPKVDDADIALHLMTFAWYLTLAGTLALPVMIMLSAQLYDAVPWAPNMGAFIIALGAVLIAAAFPIASQYRNLSVTVMKEYAVSRTLNVQSVKKLTRLMIFGAACAELPAFAGLAYFFMTRDPIGSMLLCAPGVIMMMVLYRPGDLRSV